MQIQGKQGVVQQASRKADRKKKFEKQLKEAIGLRKVIEIMTRSHKTIVGHNLLIDLMYIWSQFIAKLPSKLEIFRAMVGEKFDRYSPFISALIFKDL
jgi:CAF1 family ribonuclease